MPEKPRGLTDAEVKLSLEKNGYNTLPEIAPPTDLKLFLYQLKSPLVYILLFAGIVTLILGEYSDTVIILFAVAINTILGFVQERKANKALSALKAMVQPQARVLRNGELIKIDASQIVPGDLVSLRNGEKIPADGKIVEAVRFTISEAVLTGESVPVEKREGEKAYQGTIITGGSGLMVVETTGGKTEVGKIAQSVQDASEETPFEKQLGVFSKQLSILVLALTLFVLISGLITGVPVVEIFKTSVALAVSSIPEGLLVALTVVLAVGMQRILTKQGLVRNLLSAETLGGVTTICIDKTGTLTEGKLKVVESVGNRSEIIKQAFITNDDPVMEPALVWIRKLNPNFEEESASLSAKFERLDSIPFSPENRYFATLNRWDKDENMVFVNGAPEVLLNSSVVEDNERNKLNDLIDSYTLEGKRVIGLARKRISSDKTSISEGDLKEGLDWIGMLVFFDPVRIGVGKVLAKLKSSGIKIILVTGDYARTAATVMNELGIEVKKDDIVLGESLEVMTVSEVSEKLKILLEGQKTIVFARTKPQQKLKIVEALKKNGEVVAMMGDGVNDAPALKNADIGIVVGTATDVAKESADLVLLDSDFETVVEAIEEGRGIFDNLRKIVLYLMSDAFEEIVAVVGTIILRLPLPVTAAQILWINIVSDGFPHLALTVDPKGKDIMERLPRLPSEHVVSPWMRKLIVVVSGVGGALALAVFIYVYKTSNNLQLAQSAAFATLGINSLVYVFSVRTLTQPFWKERPFANKWLNVAVVAGILFQIFPFMNSSTRSFFKLELLPLPLWLMVFASSIIVFITIEVTKSIIKVKQES